MISDYIIYNKKEIENLIIWDTSNEKNLKFIFRNVKIKKPGLVFIDFGRYYEVYRRSKRRSGVYFFVIYKFKEEINNYGYEESEIFEEGNTKFS